MLYPADIKCPTCRASQGRPCRDHSTRSTMSDFHPDRVALAEVPNPPVRLRANNQDAFGKWVMRGIAIGIGLVIVQIPLALIAMAGVNYQLSRIGF